MEKIDFLFLTGECDNAVQLNSLLQTEHPDLLFLDIEMPYLSGLDLLAGLSNPPKVIITSAYEQYALKGYELDVVDYLLKPISFERFLKAVNKVHTMLQDQVVSSQPDYIFVKSDKQLKKVYLNDILFIESLENYVIIHTDTSREVVISTLKHFMDSLPEKKFLQVHRSYVVNVERIRAIEGNQLKIGEHKVPIGRSGRDKVLETILANRMIR